MLRFTSTRIKPIHHTFDSAVRNFSIHHGRPLNSTTSLHTISTAIDADNTIQLHQSSMDSRHKPNPAWEPTIPHPGYRLDDIQHVAQSHHEPSQVHDRIVLYAVKMMRSGFDLISGYRGPGGGMTERDWLNRCVFLENVAGVPGMVAGMARHLRSLRSMQRDHGWIQSLLEEAENERMHLLIFVELRQPGWLFRLAVLGAQGLFFNAFFLTYLVSPRSCHRFVGYLEEEAVKTYTSLLQDIDEGHLPTWRSQSAPPIARAYYGLPDNANVAQLIHYVRADEASHRDVNHTLAGLPDGAMNPFVTRSVHSRAGC